MAWAAARVDVQLDGLAAVRASQEQAFVHYAYRCTASAPGTNQLRSISVAALIALRNALVHAESSFQPHGRDLPLAERGTLERKLRGKFELSTMVADTEPFLWQRCLSAGCAKWAVETKTTYLNELYAVMGIGHKASIAWDTPCEYWE